MVVLMAAPLDSPHLHRMVVKLFVTSEICELMKNTFCVTECLLLIFRLLLNISLIILSVSKMLFIILPQRGKGVLF